MESITQNHPTKYWHNLPDGKIQCALCPNACKLDEGQRGICFVRMRENNQVVLTTYGRSSGLWVDPIEKKPLYHFLPGTSALSFGTAGCNLACKFCQNWDLSKARSTDILTETATPKIIATRAQQAKCASVAFTYNEPIIFMEYAVDTAKECHKLGIKTVAVTNGYICEKPRQDFFAHMDAANVDLKGFSEEFYKKITNSKLQPVLDTLVYLKHQTNVWLEITTLLIPGLNDSEKEIDQESKWIIDNLGPDVPIHFTAFHPAWKMQDIPPTPLQTLTMAREIALKNGIHYAYTGNLYNPDGNNTYCHNCKKLTIVRQSFSVVEYNLTETGKCKFCNTACPGVFN